MPPKKNETSLGNGNNPDAELVESLKEPKALLGKLIERTRRRKRLNDCLCRRQQCEYSGVKYMEPFCCTLVGLAAAYYAVYYRAPFPLLADFVMPFVVAA